MEMPPQFPSGRTVDLESLPLFARALVAARMARRAVLAMLEGKEREAGLALCDLVEQIVQRRASWKASAAQIRAVERIRRTRTNTAALEAARWAFDAAGAAQASLDFPLDDGVATSARRCLAAIESDRRVSAVQVAIVLAADVDQVAFACSEVGVGMYDGVPPHVMGRLAPCHPLTLTEPRRSAAEEAR